MLVENFYRHFFLKYNSFLQFKVNLDFLQFH